MSTSRRKNVDQSGKEIGKGDMVVVERIPESLLRGLPEDDQQAISACVGHLLEIQGFNTDGEAELEFTDQTQNFHTIWVATNCLTKK